MVLSRLGAGTEPTWLVLKAQGGRQWEMGGQTGKVGPDGGG